MPRTVTLTIDGASITVAENTTVAVAVWNLSGPDMRVSIERQSRGPICGMGICHECRVTIDGSRHQRSCLIRCQPGMEVATRHG